MDITKLSQWSELFSVIEPNQFFNRTTPVHHQQMYLCAPISLANNIQRLCPKILDGRDSIRICIAGAELMDTFNDGNAYSVLEKIFDSSIEWQLDFVGLEIHNRRSFGIQITKNIGTNVKCNFFNFSLGRYIKEHGVPDLVSINCPGFEEFYESWLVNDSGIKDCLINNIPVIGTSYGNDEAEIDQIYSRSYGFKIIDIYDNQYTIGGSPIDFNEAADSSMNWSGQGWRMVKGNFQRDDELIELIEEQNKFLHEISDGSIETTYYQRFDLIHKEGSKVLYKIGRDLAFDIDDKAIVNSQGQTVIEDIELDTTYLSDDLTTPAQALLIIAIIRRDYLSEIDNAGFSQFNSLSESVEELKEFLKSNNIDSDLSELSSFIFGKAAKEMTPINIKINKLINNDDYASLSSFSDKQLHDFTTENHQNLMHLAALKNSEALYEIAKIVKIKPEDRDGDFFNAVDICAEKDSIEIFYRIKNDFPDFDFNDCDPKGFNVMARALTYGSPRMIKALKKIGLEPTLGHAAQMFKDMQ
jgi:hypothetical protein